MEPIIHTRPGFYARLAQAVRECREGGYDCLGIARDYTYPAHSEDIPRGGGGHNYVAMPPRTLEDVWHLDMWCHKHDEWGY